MSTHIRFQINHKVNILEALQTGMILLGERSGARAEVVNVRLISDNSSALGGSFFIPDPTNRDNPSFETGSNVFTLTNNPDNDQNDATTVAEEAYATSGHLKHFRIKFFRLEMQGLNLRNYSKAKLLIELLAQK